MNETSRDSPYLVVDASVSLKWVLDDEDGVVPSVALRDDAHRGQIEMVAPSLWLYEVTNALVVAYLKSRVDLQQGSLALALLVDQGVRMADPEPMDCLEIATSFEISGYDAAYVAEHGPSALAGEGTHDPYGVWGPRVHKPVVLAVQNPA